MCATKVTTRPEDDEDRPGPPFQWWSPSLPWHVLGTGAGGCFVGTLLGGLVAAVTGFPISPCMAFGMALGGITGAGVFGYGQLRAAIGQGKRTRDEPLPPLPPRAGLSTHIQASCHGLTTAPPRRVKRFEAHDGWVTAAAVSPDGRSLLSGGADRAVTLGDLASGFEVRELGSFPGVVRAVAFWPEGRLAAASGLTRSEWSSDCAGFALVWDVESGRELRRFDAKGLVQALAFSPDGRALLLTGSDYLRVWDLETAEMLALISLSTGLMSGECVRSLAVSPDGRFALCGCLTSDQAWLVDLERGEWLRRFTGHRTGLLSLSLPTVTGVAFSPDGRRVLTGGLDQTARVWDADTGKELACFRGHAGRWGWRGVVGVAFLPDGRRALSASWDGTVRLWDAAGGEELARFEHGARVGCLAVSRDGRLAVSGGKDGAVRVWELPPDG